MKGKLTLTIQTFWDRRSVNQSKFYQCIIKCIRKLSEVIRHRYKKYYNDDFIWQIDSDDGDCEVFIYKTIDGSTIAVPVEYLDDSIYDEIFGCQDKVISGSLPDLPSGDSLKVSCWNFFMIFMNKM